MVDDIQGDNGALEAIAAQGLGDRNLEAANQLRQARGEIDALRKTLEGVRLHEARLKSENLSLSDRLQQAERNAASLLPRLSRLETLVAETSGRAEKERQVVEQELASLRICYERVLGSRGWRVLALLRSLLRH